MKFTVVFKPNTSFDYGVRLIVNLPFVRSRAKSIPIRLTHDGNEEYIEEVEIFVPKRLSSEVPKSFRRDLMRLSPQIASVQRT